MGKQKPLIADISDEEDAAITAAAEADPDNPIWTDEDFSCAKPVWAYPELVEVLRTSGKLPPAATDREAVTLRLDPDVLAQLRKAEGGWEDYANALLRKGLGWE